MVKLLQHDSQLSGGCRLVKTAWGGGMPPPRWPNDGYGQQNCQVLGSLLLLRGGHLLNFLFCPLSDWRYTPVKIDPELIG